MTGRRYIFKLLFIILFNSSFVFAAHETEPILNFSMPSKKSFTGEKTGIFFFSCTECEVSLSNYSSEKMQKLGPGLFLHSSKKHTMTVESIDYSGSILHFISFKSGRIKIPELVFDITKTVTGDKASSISSTTITFPGVEVEFSSALKDKNYAPLYGKITSPDYKTCAYILFLSLILLFFSTLVYKKIKSSIKLRPARKLAHDSPEMIKKRILSLKKLGVPTREAYHELSDCFKTWIELTCKINAHKILSSEIVPTLLRRQEIQTGEKISTARRTFYDRIGDTLEELKNPKFSSRIFTERELHRDIDRVIGIIDEL